jgi:hypothetical protein
MHLRVVLVLTEAVAEDVVAPDHKKWQIFNFFQQIVEIAGDHFERTAHVVN